MYLWPSPHFLFQDFFTSSPFPFPSVPSWSPPLFYPPLHFSPFPFPFPHASQTSLKLSSLLSLTDAGITSMYQHKTCLQNIQKAFRVDGVLNKPHSFIIKKKKNSHYCSSVWLTRLPPPHPNHTMLQKIWLDLIQKTRSPWVKLGFSDFWTSVYSSLDSSGKSLHITRTALSYLF